MLRRAGDGAVHVELFRHALAREAAQAPQRDLDVARVELDVAVEVPERALVPDLDRAAAAACRPARCGCPRGCSRRRRRARAAGADPFRAARVAPLLLLEPLPERLHQLVPAAQRLDPSPCPRRTAARSNSLRSHSSGISGADVEDRLHSLEIGGEREVVAVELRLVLDERGAREVVEIVDRQRHDARFERLEQRQELARARPAARAALRCRKKPISIAMLDPFSAALPSKLGPSRCLFTAGHSGSTMLNTHGVAHASVGHRLVVAQHAVLLRAEARDRLARLRS